MNDHSIEEAGERKDGWSSGDRSTAGEPESGSKLRRRLRALGVWGFLFFLVKGLLWLAIPAAIAAWRWLSG
jgi:hypothetical protein